MKLSMEQTAYVTGKSKKTIYNHKDANKFSWEINNDGNAVIDASELLRVYGTDDGIPQRLEELQMGGSPSVTSSVSVSEITPSYTVKPSVKKPLLGEEDYIEFIRLKEEKKFRDEKITLLEEEKEKWEKLAYEAQTTAQRITLLLEDHREKEGRGEVWEKSIRALEQRIANQEKAAKEREEKEQKLLDENERIKKAYSRQKKELQAEKNKSLWQKLFG